MTNKTLMLAMSALISAGILTGCASNDSSMVYSQNQMRQAQSVQLGTVVSVHPVKMEGSNNELLTLGGAALGGLAGSNLGNGSKANAAGAIVGALAGGFGANAAQKAVGTKNALEITVKLDSGRMVSIVQDADVQFEVKQRVRVLSGRGTDRVVPF
ncbi:MULTISPECIES: glycine zipper 2TM domain-containing protein [unclassified Paludibacterium]|uniref:glycine zipper 2TM domain-containing protein n=1 Tax=unclassified Paludibacterium TaxID=2618429 RepID=UPI001C04EC64|nr:glycine zipper 2TM domain-containing protein [Paludibacterium sp. B53371]BEV70649.1 glycine zipper 2TM domain-containing protein [Paludibacterium sp. THUN1379]